MPVHLIGQAQSFKFSNPLFLGDYCVEAQLILDGYGDLKMVYGVDGFGVHMISYNASTKAGHLNGPQLVPGICRFPYIFNDHRGVTVLIGGSQQNGGDVYMWFTGDPSMLNWTKVATPIFRITETVPTIFNVTILPVKDTWHVLFDGGGGLRYCAVPAPGHPSQGVNLNAVPNALAIPNGGCCDLVLSPSGKDLVAYIGKWDGSYGVDNPYTTIATAPLTSNLSDPASWTLHKDAFSFGQNSIAICDPAVYDGPEGATILFSYDQLHMRELTRSRPLAELNDYLAR